MAADENVPLKFYMHLVVAGGTRGETKGNLLTYFLLLLLLLLLLTQTTTRTNYYYYY